MGERKKNLPNNIRLWNLRKYGEWKSKAKEVWPVGLDEGKPLVEFPAHVEPLVLERVQRVQQAHVNQA